MITTVGHAAAAAVRCHACKQRYEVGWWQRMVQRIDQHAAIVCCVRIGSTAHHAYKLHRSAKVQVWCCRTQYSTIAWLSGCSKYHSPAHAGCFVHRSNSRAAAAHLSDASTSPRSYRSCDLLSTMLASTLRRLRGTGSSPRCSSSSVVGTTQVAEAQAGVRACRVVKVQASAQSHMHVWPCMFGHARLTTLQEGGLQRRHELQRCRQSHH